MRKLIAAELLKLRTTRLFYALLATTAVLTVLGVVVVILIAGGSDTPNLGSQESTRNIFGNGSASLFALILGILAVTGEIRHGTITQTLLVTPRRSDVVTAKLVAMGVAGLVFGGVASLVTLAVAWPWLAAKDVGVSLFSDDVGLVMLAGIAGTVLFGIIGVGVGAIVRSQVPAIVGALVWQFVLESLLVALLPAVGRWLPGGAARGLSGETLSSGSLLPVWVAGLVLVAYGVVFAAIGAQILARRDVT